MRNRESQARSSVLPRDRCIRLRELFKDLAELVLGNSNAGIAY